MVIVNPTALSGAVAGEGAVGDPQLSLVVNPDTAAHEGFGLVAADRCVGDIDLSRQRIAGMQVQAAAVGIGETLSEEVPLHFSRFFPAYKLTSLPATPIDTLEEAAQTAYEQGLKYVYIGNVPGHERNSTFYPQCGEKIIKRIHFAVISLDVINGKCRFCGHSIPSIWEKT